MLKKYLLLAGLISLTQLSGCTESFSLLGPTLETQCSNAVSNAYTQIHNPSKGSNKNTTLAWTKAANLLSEAIVYQRQQNFTACIDSAKKASEMAQAAK